MNDFDSLLAAVSAQARAAGVPISGSIEPVVAVNTRAKRRFGMCRKTGKGFRIELSAVLLDAPEKSAKQTIAHELIHTCPGCFDHGSRFAEYAAVMNRRYGYSIKRTSSAEELGVCVDTSAAKYIIKCADCANTITRMRKSRLLSQLDRCRCPVCGGRLYLDGGEALPEPETAPKYILQCRKCGAEIPRMKKSRAVMHPSQYRCRCGGSLKRIK